MIALRARPAILGIAVLTAGILLVLFGGQTIIKDVYTIRTEELVNITVEVDDNSYWSVDRRISRTSTVVGKGTVTASLTRAPSDISFFVLDSTNFEKWRQRQSGGYYMVKMIQVEDKFTFNFSVSRNDTYHFVFDNYYSTVKKSVGIQVSNSYGTIEKQAVLDRTLNYAGIAVVGLGAVLAIYGFAMPPELVWSKDHAF